MTEPEGPHHPRHGRRCQEVMSDDTLLPDLAFSGKGTILGKASDIRPGDKPLTVELPEDDTQNRPSVTITLPDDPTSGRLPLVKRLTFTGTFRELEIELTGENLKTGAPETFKTRVVNDNEPILLKALRTKDGKHAPIFIESITVTILSGDQGSVVTLEMQMVACLRAIGKQIYFQCKLIF